MEGWIKLHRSIQDHWLWHDEKYFRWWMTILLNVNHEVKNFPVNGELVDCNPGESFRSIQQWSDLFRCGKPTTIKFFDMLKKDCMIDTKIVGRGNRRKHLLSVVNWGKYQQTDTENFTETKPKTLPKQNPNIPSNKNDKNEKNIYTTNVVLSPHAEGTHQSIQKTDDSGDKSERIDYLGIERYWNENNHSMPKIKVMTEKRKAAVRARWKEHGRASVGTVLKKSFVSHFLNGNNKNNWIADFDWIMRPTNFVKILEGAYDENNRKFINGRQLSSAEEAYIRNTENILARAGQE